VKLPAIIAVVSAAALSAPADPTTWQELSARLFTNAAIVWQIPTNQMPKSLWIYRRILPHVFPEGVISNAVVLGSLQNRGFPPSTTNDVRILQQVPENWPAPIPTLLGIIPGDAYLYFSIPQYGPVSQKGFPGDETIVGLARKYAPQLGLDPATLTHQRIYTHSCDTDQTADNFCGRGVFFPRFLDEVSFFSAEDSGDSAEGFSMEFGERGKIQAFWVRWSKLERYKNERTASPDDIIRCIRLHKAIVMPNFQPDDFIRLRNLARTKKLTIIKITPYYGEGMFGEVPTNNVPNGFATPFAELEAIADLGTSNAPVKLLLPILSSEARRLLSISSQPAQNQ
jgi:hypothetical protein